MPEHHYMFTAPSEVEVQVPTYSNGAERAAVVCGRGIQLRRMLPDELKFSPAGTYWESYATLPDYRANALTGLYGFQVQKELEGGKDSDLFGGSVAYRLSNDGGATWLVYDAGTSVWVSAVGAFAGTWMTEDEVDLRIQSFPLTDERRIRTRVRMTPATGGKRTPLVKRVTLFVSFDFDFQDDVLRSLKHHIEREMRVRTTWTVDIVNQDRVEVEHKWEVLYAPCTAYNLTTDPGRTTNLFSSIDGKGVRLTSIQTGQIEVKVFAQPEVFIAAEDFFEIAVIPSVVINAPQVKERRDLRNGNGEFDIALQRGTAKEWFSRVYFEVSARISSQSPTKLEAVEMGEALNRALTHYRTVLSEATGETMAVHSATPFSAAHRVATGLFVNEFDVALFGKNWLRPDMVQDKYLARKLVFAVHGPDPKGTEEMEVTNV